MVELKGTIEAISICVDDVQCIYYDICYTVRVHVGQIDSSLL